MYTGGRNIDGKLNKIVCTTHVIVTLARISVGGGSGGGGPECAEAASQYLGSIVSLVDRRGQVFLHFHSFEGSNNEGLGIGIETILLDVTVLPPFTVRTAGMIRPRGLGSGIPLGVGSLAIVFAVASHR